MILDSVPDDLLCQHVPKALAKLERFQQDGIDQLQLVFDFDRTLTVGRAGIAGDITTWHILKEHLPEAGKRRYQKLFEYYRALELKRSMNQENAITWWSSILDLFVEYKIDMNEVERDFLAKATIRPGTKELFDLCAARGIPTIILSAGIRDVIVLWARTYDIKPTIVLSTSLQLDPDNRVCGWDKNSLVHALSKKEIAHPELSRIRHERQNTILIGDSLDDANMAEGDGSVFRVRIHDPRNDEVTSGVPNHAQTFELFDAVIEAGELRAISELVRQIA